MGSVLLTGCPGEIHDPGLFRDAASVRDATLQRDATPSHDGASVADAASSCALDVQQDILQPRCGVGGCHDDSGQPAAQLDLTVEDPADALSGTMASMCSGRTLIVPGDPDGSFLFEKVNAEDPECGRPMPLTGEALDEDEVACLRAWIADLGGAGDAGAGARDAAAGDAGGSRGAMTGGGGDG